MEEAVSRRGLWAAPLVALAMTILCGASSAQVGGDYAPAKAEKTMKSLGWLCWIKSFCPLTAKNYETLKRSVDGHRDDRYLLGLLLSFGDGFPMDRDGGIAWIAMAAEQGSALAVIYVERRIQNGAHIEYDETKAADLLKKDVARNDIDAMRALGPMTIRGRGTAQDPEAGLALLRKAASLGSKAAELDLANLYLIGTNGLPHNRNEGLKWYGVAASHGDLDAMLSLGSLWRNAPMDDRSFKTDVALAYCWLVRAAMMDKAAAQYDLALVLSRGEHDDRGVIPKDLIQADYWFRLGARNPEYDNSQVRGDIEPKMTTAEINEVKKRLAIWHKHEFAEVKAAKIAASADGARQCPPME